MNSDAPEWLVEIITNQSRLMSSTPKSVADAVWWEFRKRVAIEVKEELDIKADHLKNNLIAQMTAEIDVQPLSRYEQYVDAVFRASESH